MNIYGDKSIIPDDVEAGTLAPELALKHSGLELLQMMIAGELPPPPIAKLTNILLSEAEWARRSFAAYRATIIIIRWER